MQRFQPAAWAADQALPNPTPSTTEPETPAHSPVACLIAVPQPPAGAHHRARSLRRARGAHHSTGVLCIERRGLGVGRVLLFDLQGWITLLAGALLALITLFTSYGHVDIPGAGPILLNQQAGVLLILASLATLAGDVELATRRRL